MDEEVSRRPFSRCAVGVPCLCAEFGQIEPGQFLVYFDTDQANLGPGATQVVTEAAQAYQQTGAAQIEVIGHTDTTGSAEQNLALSQRRAERVADELIRQGVPAIDIATIGRGKEHLLVPTADGVNEPANRRVEIVVPPPAPVAEAAPEVEPAAPPEEEPDRFAFTIGPMYGHNFGETNDGGENDLAGAQLTFDVLPGFLGGVSLKQGLLWSFNGEDDGTRRSVAALGVAPDLGFVRPILGINGGGVYGAGVQDGFVVGPEIGLGLELIENVAMRAYVAYDYQFRQPDWDEGILWGGLNFGVRF